MNLFENCFYSRKAIGKNGKIINIFKISTMVSDANLSLESCLEYAGVDAFGRPINDPRVIESRAWMRKYWVDELPQLLNLALGELRLLGIRPND